LQVRVRTLPVDEGAEAFYAQDQGFFSEPMGARTDVGTMPTGPGIVAAVAAGDIEIGFANLFAFVQAFARGASIRVLAPGQLFRVEDSKSFALVVRADSPYRAAKDLNGKTIGANAPVSLVAIGARLWIDRNGGDSSAIKIVQVPFGSESQALESGAVDAVSSIFTNLAGLKNTRVLGYPTDAIGPPFIGSGWYARAAWIDANRDAARRYAHALLEAARWGNSHQADSGRILMKYLHLAR
jgi:NitT/TauT family transport system substrate-binding protein